ncbi:hypothetical protein [Asaia spathodeae]|nr:hypothetical protein [Asaia spathodeae]
MSFKAINQFHDEYSLVKGIAKFLAEGVAFASLMTLATIIIDLI